MRMLRRRTLPAREGLAPPRLHRPRWAGCITAVLLGTLGGRAVQPAQAAPRTRIAVVHAETTLEPAERGYSRAMARNLARWLDDAGLAAVVLPDNQLAEALSPPRQVVHLIGLDRPTPAMLRDLDRYLGQGGRLIVYNSMSEELAGRLGLRIERYLPAPGHGHWTDFRFVDQAVPHVPRRVRQTPAALRVALPADSRGEVVAWWHGRDGQRTAQPAWLRHPHGFWMTQVLLGDADRESRRRLLTAISAAGRPELWQEAATTLSRRLTQSLGAANPAEAMRAIRARCPPSRTAELDLLLREIDATQRRAEQARSRGAQAEATVALWHLRTLWNEAQATVQTPWPDGIRAVWDHAGAGLHLGDWDATCRDLARHGITDLLLLVATPLGTHATIPGLAPSPLRRDHGDQLATALDAGRRHGVRVHAWVVALNPAFEGTRHLAALEAEGRLLTDREGQRRNWLDPTHAANRTRLRDTVRHIAERYPVDGIHLDYIRFADFRAGFGPRLRAGFEAHIGRSVSDWPRDVLTPSRPLYQPFIAYRAGLIERLVAEVRSDLRAVAPRITLSAAVYGRYPLCIESVGQDWVGWLQRDLLDWAVPMNYTDSLDALQRYLDQPALDRTLRPRILSGVGVTSAEASLDAVQVLDQIQAARERGFGGYALFDLNAALHSEILPFLSLGLHRSP